MLAKAFSKLLLMALVRKPALVVSSGTNSLCCSSFMDDVVGTSSAADGSAKMQDSSTRCTSFMSSIKMCCYLVFGYKVK